MAEITIKVTENEVKTVRTLLLVLAVFIFILGLKACKSEPVKVDNKTYKEFLSDCTKDLRPYECIALWRQGQG